MYRPFLNDPWRMETPRTAGGSQEAPSRESILENEVMRVTHS